MLPFVELDASRVRLAPGQALLRARDYQDYLSANRLVEAARERAAEIEREAHEVYQEQKRLGWEAGLEEARLRQAGLIRKRYCAAIATTGRSIASLARWCCRRCARCCATTTLSS